MKIRTDILRMYKDVHSWVGIIAGLALFIAFYAGAITMFEEPLQRWASAPTELAPPPTIKDTPRLVEAVLAAHPEAAKSYDINLDVGPDLPGRVSWSEGQAGGEHGLRETYYASLGPDGTLQVDSEGSSAVAQFVDVLHQQVGLPFSHEIAMPIMGAISLLYAIAIISGLIVLLPSLVKDLFALRIGRNVKRMWLDVHNVLGVFSLPFHLVMALTAVVFAFHDQFYDAQALAFARPEAAAPIAAAPPPAQRHMLSPVEIVDRLRAQAPGFTPTVLSYGKGRDGGTSLRVSGHDPRYGLRGPTFGMAGVDPHDGRIVMDDYMPGRQDGWGATITSFFALHFGSFGGAAIRWAYFLLGLAGAFLFYTGNLLWIESRRKRERKAGLVEQTRATRVLAAITVGVTLGCVAGISVTIAAAKLLGRDASYGLHSGIYYGIFLGFVGWALVRGASRAATDLLLGCAISMAFIPLANLFSGTGWNGSASIIVDIVAMTVGLSLLTAWRSTIARTRGGKRDSVWYDTTPRRTHAGGRWAATDPQRIPKNGEAEGV